MLIVEIIWAALVIACIIGLVLNIKGVLESRKALKRNKEVYLFRLQLLDLASAHNIKRLKDGTLTDENDALIWFFGKYTYDMMFYSDKPLTLEAWFTEEEITRIKS